MAAPNGSTPGNLPAVNKRMPVPMVENIARSEGVDLNGATNNTMRVARIQEHRANPTLWALTPALPTPPIAPVPPVQPAFVPAPAPTTVVAPVPVPAPVVEPVPPVVEHHHHHEVEERRGSSAWPWVVLALGVLFIAAWLVGSAFGWIRPLGLSSQPSISVSAVATQTLDAHGVGSNNGNANGIGNAASIGASSTATAVRKGCGTKPRPRKECLWPRH